MYKEMKGIKGNSVGVWISSVFLLFGRLLYAQTRKVNSRGEFGWVGAGWYRVVVWIMNKKDCFERNVIKQQGPSLYFVPVKCSKYSN